MRPAPLKKDRWNVSSDELDHRGKPAVVCRNGDREFLFSRGCRGRMDVWVCWERTFMFTNRRLEAPDRTDAEQAASAAQSELARLEPGFGVYLDLASEDEEVGS
jgi:hypothetical protein